MKNSLRRYVFLRDENKCQHPLHDPTDDGLKLTLHHITPRLVYNMWFPLEEPDNAGNLICLCSKCHQGEQMTMGDLARIIHADQAWEAMHYPEGIIPAKGWECLHKARRKKCAKHRPHWNNLFDYYFQTVVKENDVKMWDTFMYLPQHHQELVF